MAKGWLRRLQAWDRRRWVMAGAIILGALLIGWYVKHRIERAEIEKHWIRLKGFSGAVVRGSVKSMKPVELSIWRYRTSKIPETTHEHLEFAIPAAYLHWKDDLSGGKQEKIVLSVHWPSGDPGCSTLREE